MTWPLVPLRDLGRWYGGGTPSKSNSAFWADGKHPWLSPKDMGVSTLTHTRDHITAEAVAGTSVKKVPEGSVAVVVRSGILERTLPVAFVPFATTLNQDMKAVVPRHGIDARWVAWGLRAFERELLRVTRKAGTTVASIEMPRFYAFELPVPPLGEQRRLVDILEDHLARLDAADRGLETARQRLERLLLALLTAEVRRLREEGARYAGIGEVADTALGKMLDAKRAEGEPTPYLANINVRWGRIEMDDLKEVRLAPEERDRLTLEAGDVLACEGGEPGRCAVWQLAGSPVVFQKALHRIRVKDRRLVAPDFLALMLREAIQSGRSKSFFTGTTIKHLPQEKLRRIRLPIPTNAAQKSIVARARAIDDASTHLHGELRSATRRSAALRRALLAAAFAGKLTGRHTDDEVIEEMAQ